MRSLLKATYVKIAAAIAALFSFAHFVLFHPDIASSAALSGIGVCLSAIIPSLFAFMVLSSYLVESGLYQLISIPFYPIARYIFRIEPKLISVVLISLIGGYPIGAKLLTELVERGALTPKEAEQLLCYCYGSGPSYIIGLVGAQVFASFEIGVKMYGSAVLANLILGTLIGLFRRFPVKSRSETVLNLTSDALIRSVNSTTKALLSVCSMIVLFTVVIAQLRAYGFTDWLASKLGINGAVFDSMLEINHVLGFYGLVEEIPVIGALLAFGGVCVVMQLSSIIKGRFRMRMFMLTRPLAAALSGAICWLMTRGMNQNLIVWASGDQHIRLHAVSPAASGILLAMTVMLLLLCRKRT